MPDLLRQLDSVLEALSADSTKPFDLNESFPRASQGRVWHNLPDIWQQNWLAMNESRSPPYQHIGFERPTETPYGFQDGK